MRYQDRVDAYVFLVGACQTQDEVDRLWRDCFGTEPPTRVVTTPETATHLDAWASDR